MLAAALTTCAVLAAGADARLQQALALEQQGEDERALRAVEALVREQPSWALPRLEAGRMRLKRGEGIDAAELDLDVARSLAPENPRAHYLWGLLSSERGRPEQAASALRVALGPARRLRRRALPAGRARLRRRALRRGRGLARHLRGRAPRGHRRPPAARRRRWREPARRQGRREGARGSSPPRPATRAVALSRLADLLQRQGRVAEAASVRSALEAPHRAMRPLQRSGR